MFETEINIRKITDIMDWTIKGFPYLAVDRKTQIYIPMDRRVWLNYGVKGSIVKNGKNYTIKKGSENITYVVFISVMHDKTVQVTNINVSVDGDVINELNYDDPGKFSTYIIRLIEVSPNSTFTVEFDVGGKHHTILYTNDRVENLEN